MKLKVIVLGGAGLGAIRLDVWGSQDGVEVRRMACSFGEMREATGLSLSVGTLILARTDGLLAEKGVYAPEACPDPRTFLGALETRGVQAYEDLEMTQSLRRR
jgi:hypothetical protein